MNFTAKKIKTATSLIILLIATTSTWAQDSIKFVKYSQDYRFTEGIYLNFEQVKYNAPIPKIRTISAVDYSAHDFFEKLLAGPMVYFYDNLGARIEIPTALIWGYCRRGTLYVNYNNEFNRIPVVGTLSHFVANKVVYDNRSYDRYYNPYYSNMRQPTAATVELRQYILNFRTGQIFDYNQVAFESILMKDPELFDEYSSLKRKKKKQLRFFYLRKHNERNPLMMPEN